MQPRRHDGNIMVESPATMSPSTSGSSALSRMSPIERSRYLRVVRMQPLLQLMVGPLLRYDTVDERGIWHGFCLVVSEYWQFLCYYQYSLTPLAAADAGSDYEPYPFITYEWDPGRPLRETNNHTGTTDGRPSRR